MEVLVFPKENQMFNSLTKIQIAFKGVTLRPDYEASLAADTIDDMQEGKIVHLMLIFSHRFTEGLSSTWIRLTLEKGDEYFSPNDLLQGKTIDLQSFMYSSTNGGYEHCWFGNLISLIAAKEVQNAAVSYRPHKLAEANQVRVKMQIGNQVFVGTADLQEASKSLELN
jgi:hypothetical protein